VASMMDSMMDWMGAWAIVALVVVVVVVAAGVYVGIKALGGDRSARKPDTESARALLDRRLAAGEIAPEEYHERESALRSSEQATARSRRRS
jgi:uncharacterized membrane protein